MGFWIFMFAVAIICPVIMILLGMLFRKAGPKRINCVYGYRTARSMKNRDTWDYAHRYISRFSLRFGPVLLLLSAVPMLFLIGKSEELIATIGLVIAFVGLIALFITIFNTESALKRTFDENGYRRSMS